LDRASFVPLRQQLYPRLRERVLGGRVGEGAAPALDGTELDAGGQR
jgi:hypothetical protein